MGGGEGALTSFSTPTPLSACDHRQASRGRGNLEIPILQVYRLFVFLSTKKRVQLGWTLGSDTFSGAGTSDPYGKSYGLYPYIYSYTLILLYPYTLTGHGRARAGTGGLRIFILLPFVLYLIFSINNILFFVFLLTLSLFPFFLLRLFCFPALSFCLLFSRLLIHGLG